MISFLRYAAGATVLRPTQANKWLVVFCDEINLPAADRYGTQVQFNSIQFWQSNFSNVFVLKKTNQRVITFMRQLGNIKKTKSTNCQRIPIVRRLYSGGRRILANRRSRLDSTRTHSIRWRLCMHYNIFECCCCRKFIICKLIDTILWLYRIRRRMLVECLSRLDICVTRRCCLSTFRHQTRCVRSR